MSSDRLEKQSYYELASLVASHTAALAFGVILGVFAFRTPVVDACSRQTGLPTPGTACQQLAGTSNTLIKIALLVMVAGITAAVVADALEDQSGGPINRLQELVDAMSARLQSMNEES